MMTLTPVETTFVLLLVASIYVVGIFTGYMICLIRNMKKPKPEVADEGKD